LAVVDAAIDAATAIAATWFWSQWFIEVQDSRKGCGNVVATIKQCQGGSSSSARERRILLDAERVTREEAIDDAASDFIVRRYEGQIYSVRSSANSVRAWGCGETALRAWRVTTAGIATA
jgi:hypothetical protein